MKKGFTLIEIIVVVGIISILIPTIFAVFFLIAQQNLRLARFSEVNRQGNFAINTIEDLILKNAVSIHSAVPNNDANENKICDIATSSQLYIGDLYFKDKKGNHFYFDAIGTPAKIASQSSITNASAEIISPKVIVSNFSSKCKSAGFSGALVNYSFDLCYNLNNSCGEASEKVSLHFGTTIFLRQD